MATDRHIFLLEAEETRDLFVQKVYSMEWDNEHRTKSESLLIMFDQAIEIIRNGIVLENEKHNPIYFESEVMQKKGILNEWENDFDKSKVRKS